MKSVIKWVIRKFGRKKLQLHREFENKKKNFNGHEKIDKIENVWSSKLDYYIKTKRAMRLKSNKIQSKLSSKRRIGLISIKHF